MAFKKKTWEDRLSEFPGRRLLKIISRSSDDSEFVADVSRNEGVVSRNGNAFSAANMNDLEQRIEEEFNIINGNLGSYLALRDVATTSGLTTGLNWVNFTIPQISRYTPRLFLYAGNSTNAAIINYARNALILSSATTISIPIYNNQNALTSVGFSGIVVYTKDIKS